MPLFTLLSKIDESCGFSPASARRLEETDPTFPRRRELYPGSKVQGYVTAELAAWIASRPVVQTKPDRTAKARAARAKAHGVENQEVAR